MGAAPLRWGHYFRARDSLLRMLRRLSVSDWMYSAVVFAFTLATVRVWWLSAIVPGMDYPQFLVFVRAAADCGDVSSPFHGTYETASWLVPTVLPIQLVRFASLVSHTSLEAAGRGLLAAQGVGLVGASAFLLHALGRPRWAIALLFPLIHSRWTVVGGYVLFATSIPLVVLGWALAVRWLEDRRPRRGAMLAACLCATLLWHGIGFVVLGLGYAVLWATWRAPSWRARAWACAPALPAAMQCVAWIASTFGVVPAGAGGPSPPVWMAPQDAADSIVEYVWTSVPHARGLAAVFALLVLLGSVFGPAQRSPAHVGATRWHARNPFAVLSVAYLAAYFGFPMYVAHVEGVANRFAYPAALAFVFAWSPPHRIAARALTLAAVLGFSAYCLVDLSSRFRAFDVETRGASALIDRVAPRDTLYYWPQDQGASKAFADAHKPTRELQQYASIRSGGLPNSSFAGYGINYIRYVGGHNPMPGLAGPPRWIPSITRFDYVLSRAGQGPADPRFLLIDKNEGWELYGVCGSARFPSCS